MRVVVDEKSGFCPGVVKAIELAEAGLKDGLSVWSLGDLMHNKVEMDRLKRLGLEAIDHANIETIANSNTLLIRAHGEPPITYQRCQKKGINIIDATCKVVSRLQKIVANADLEMQKIGGQVVILGKHGHPEVIGLQGQVANNMGIVVDSLEDIEKYIDFTRPVYFLSQTTKSLKLFNEASKYILHKYKDLPSHFCTIKDTICRQVSNRAPHLEQFASEFDVVIFVAGAESSNGKALYSICQGINKKSYKIEDIEQLNPEWFANATSVGVCGATSTPRWLMDKVAKAIQTLY